MKVKPIFRNNLEHTCTVFCPNCQIVLAQGDNRGFTIALYDKCPNCETEFDWINDDTSVSKKPKEDIHFENHYKKIMENEFWRIVPLTDLSQIDNFSWKGKLKSVVQDNLIKDAYIVIRKCDNVKALFVNDEGFPIFENSLEQSNKVLAGFGKLPKEKYITIDGVHTPEADAKYIQHTFSGNIKEGFEYYFSKIENNNFTPYPKGYLEKVKGILKL